MERQNGQRKRKIDSTENPLNSPEKRECSRGERPPDLQPPQPIAQALQSSAVDLALVGRIGIDRYRYLPHNSTIWEIRNAIIDEIMRLLRENRPNASQEWLNKIEKMAFRLDEGLYIMFPNFDEYSNMTTLRLRLQQLALSVRRSMSTNTPMPDSSSGGGGSCSSGSTEIVDINKIIQDLDDFHLDGGSTQEGLGEEAAQERLTMPNEEESEASDEEEGDY